MSKTITMTLDRASIKRAQQEILAYRDEVVRKVRMLVEMLANEGANIAKIELMSMDGIDTGALMNSIVGFYDPETHIGYVRAGEGLETEYGYSYAFYVEYGTGATGMENPHDSPADGWEYDMNGHGNEGWIYWDDRRGKKRWTRGQPARPFMYETAKELTAYAYRKAKEVFG